MTSLVKMDVVISFGFVVRAETGVGSRHPKQQRGSRQRRKRPRGGRRTTRPDVIAHGDDEERVRLPPRHADDEDGDDDNDVDQHSITSRRDGQFCLSSP